MAARASGNDGAPRGYPGGAHALVRPDARRGYTRMLGLAPGTEGWPPGHAPVAARGGVPGIGQWGPRAWNWLHLAAIIYARDPSPREADEAYLRIWSFVQRLPCLDCRQHATAYVAQNPPDLDDTFSLQAWAWRFHNAVNQRLGKRALTYDEYLALYADEISWANCAEGCWIP